jgi:hypothetical protein
MSYDLLIQKKQRHGIDTAHDSSLSIHSAAFPAVPLIAMRTMEKVHTVVRKRHSGTTSGTTVSI